jgi:hypothetical protein
MIPVETVIRKLIVDYEFVILPGFGALLSHHVAASYDKETGIFHPSVKKLAFNEFLKLDDGLIANYISRHADISHSEAVAHIRRYTDRLRAVLGASGKAVIAGIGHFSTNGEGKLVFEPDTEKYFRDEWYGFQSVNARLVSGDLTLSLPKGNVAIEEAVEVVDEDDAPVRRINWWGWSAAAMLVGLIGYFSFFFASGQFENQSTLNPFRALFEKTSNTLQTTSIVADKTVSVEAEPVKEIVPVIVDSSETVEVPADSVVAVAEPEVTAIPERKFYVIAGAFKGTKQATVLLEQMQKKGFTDAIILPSDARSNKVKVAVKSFELESEAYSASRELKSVIGEVGWVYEMK